MWGPSSTSGRLAPGFFYYTMITVKRNSRALVLKRQIILTGHCVQQVWTGVLTSNITVSVVNAGAAEEECGERGRGRVRWEREESPRPGMQASFRVSPGTTTTIDTSLVTDTTIVTRFLATFTFLYRWNRLPFKRRTV